MKTNVCRSSKTCDCVCWRRDGLSNDVVQVGDLKCACEVGVNLDVLYDMMRVS